MLLKILCSIIRFSAGDTAFKGKLHASDLPFLYFPPSIHRFFGWSICFHLYISHFVFHSWTVNFHWEGNQRAKKIWQRFHQTEELNNAIVRCSHINWYYSYLRSWESVYGLAELDHSWKQKKPLSSNWIRLWKRIYWIVSHKCSLKSQ